MFYIKKCKACEASHPMPNFFVGGRLTSFISFAFPYKGHKVLNAEKLKILDNIFLVAAEKKSETFD